MEKQSRRNFITHSGTFLSTAVAASISPTKSFATSPGKKFSGTFRKAVMKDDDSVNISKDYRYEIVVKAGDKISEEHSMGENSDFVAFLPGESSNHGYLWVNNESLHSNIVWGKKIKPSEKSKEQIDFEKEQVGGSFLEVKRQKNKWTVEKASKRAFKVTAKTTIDIVGPSKARKIEGTLGNCGGGHTPWGTILTCEENYQHFYFTKQLDEGLGWNKYDQKDERDYGWVVEVDAKTKKARKLSALGRFHHEGSTVLAVKGESVVVYMGEDRVGGALFKFISRNKYTGINEKDKDLLVEGDLYAANLAKRTWEKLSPDHPKILKNPELKVKFNSREACVENAAKLAKILGATPLNRAEDIEIDPKTGDIMIALTNNKNAGDFYGQILKVTENGKHSTALTIKNHEPYLVGGPSSGFSCPDNLCYGPDGALYIATDVSGSALGKGAMSTFKKNGLFKVDFDSANNPVAVPILFAPREAEVTGPCFSADGTTLFVSIQHPGELSFKSEAKFTSNWPSKKGRPRSSIIAIQRA